MNVLNESDSDKPFTQSGFFFVFLSQFEEDIQSHSFKSNFLSTDAVSFREMSSK